MVEPASLRMSSRDVSDKSGAPEGSDQSIEARLAAQMESIILARLAADRLVLPALPAAALKCIRLLKDPELSLKTAAIAIEQDPVLTASLIRQANSAAFATREPV